MQIDGMSVKANLISALLEIKVIANIGIRTHNSDNVIESGIVFL